MEYESISITSRYLWYVKCVYVYVISVLFNFFLSHWKQCCDVLYSAFSVFAHVKREIDFYNILEDDEWKSQELLQMTAFWSCFVFVYFMNRSWY